MTAEQLLKIEQIREYAQIKFASAFYHGYIEILRLQVAFFGHSLAVCQPSGVGIP